MMSQVNCSYCDSSEIAANITVRQNAEVLEIGLGYETALGLVGTEQLLADLCTKCGNVMRLHVRVPNRKWIAQEERKG
jgi:hypothetical protein